MKNKIICITGASGGIGRKLIEKLSKNNYRLRILTRNNNHNFSNNCEIFVGDLSDSKFCLEEFIDNCDILFHCAGELKNEKKMFGLHVDGTKNLINVINREFLKSGKKIHWIQLSSCGAYGPSKKNKQRFINELSPINPENIYEKSKVKSDELVIKFSKTGIITYSILRPSNVIGLGMNNTNLLKLVKLIKSGFLFFYVPQDAMANYVHVDDVVNALVAIALKTKSKNEIFNLSSDCSWDILILKIAESENIKIKKIRIPISWFQFLLILIKFLFGKIIHVPTLSIFSNKTYFSNEKIVNTLEFEIKNHIHISIGKILKEIKLKEQI